MFAPPPCVQIPDHIIKAKMQSAGYPVGGSSQATTSPQGTKTSSADMPLKMSKRHLLKQMLKSAYSSLKNKVSPQARRKAKLAKLYRASYNWNIEAEPLEKPFYRRQGGNAWQPPTVRLFVIEEEK